MLEPNTNYKSNTPDDCWIDMNFGEYNFIISVIGPWAGIKTYYLYGIEVLTFKRLELLSFENYLYESQILGSNDNKTTWESVYNFTELNTNPYIMRYDHPIYTGINFILL